jgi:single-strand DNA-binding protein
MECHNSCFIVGYLGSDPSERGDIEKSDSVVKFSIAESVTCFDRESECDETVHTNWFQVTAFGGVADKIKRNLKKGERVAVHGRMKVSKFMDRSGVERNRFEILADEVQRVASDRPKGLRKSLKVTDSIESQKIRA